MAQRLFLLDAYALIYRAYYAFIKAPRFDSKGRNTSAVFGFVLMLEDLLSKEQPDEIAVVFDPSGGTFRHREYPAYKAQREETPEGIRIAVPLIRQLLAAYRIPAVEVPDFEADDVIGTLSVLASGAGREVLMVTPDKDYGQLVTDQVRMYRPMQGGGYETWGEREITEKFGLSSPSQVIDYLALLGDKVDNIPGCKGIAEAPQRVRLRRRAPQARLGDQGRDRQEAPRGCRRHPPLLLSGDHPKGRTHHLHRWRLYPLREGRRGRTYPLRGIGVPHPPHACLRLGSCTQASSLTPG